MWAAPVVRPARPEISLHEAVGRSNADPEMVRAVLAREDVDPNEFSSDSRPLTPLMELFFRVYNDRRVQTELVRLLLDDPRVDPNLLRPRTVQGHRAESIGMSALHMACVDHPNRTVHTLQAFAACSRVDMDMKTLRGRTCWQVAMDWPLRSFLGGWTPPKIEIMNFFLHREQKRVTADRVRMQVFLRQGSGAYIDDDVVKAELLPWLNQTLVSQSELDVVKRALKWRIDCYLSSGREFDKVKKTHDCFESLRAFLSEYGDISKFDFDLQLTEEMAKVLQNMEEIEEMEAGFSCCIM